MFSDNKKALASWSYEKNGALDPLKLTSSSHKLIWLLCNNCNHFFQRRVYELKRSWCRFCQGRQLCGSHVCLMCKEKTLAFLDKSKFLLNHFRQVDPYLISIHSRTKLLFWCDDCGHIFLSSPAQVRLRQWCPYCSKPPQKMCYDSSCDECHKKSFADDPKVNFWALENPKTARQTFKSSGVPVIFNCDCGHSFEATPSNISRGEWCPYCCIPTQRLCDNLQCKHCKERSFASHDKVLQWSDKNELTARQVPKGSKKDFWFECDI